MGGVSHVKGEGEWSPGREEGVGGREWAGLEGLEGDSVREL